MIELPDKPSPPTVSADPTAPAPAVPGSEPDFASLRRELAAALARVENLEIALTSNRTTGMATGILMAQRKLTAEQAFQLLSRASQRANRKLRDIAADVVLSGALEPPLD